MRLVYLPAALFALLFVADDVHATPYCNAFAMPESVWGSYPCPGSAPTHYNDCTAELTCVPVTANGCGGVTFIAFCSNLPANEDALNADLPANGPKPIGPKGDPLPLIADEIKRARMRALEFSKALEQRRRMHEAQAINFRTYGGKNVANLESLDALSTTKEALDKKLPKGELTGLDAKNESILTNGTKPAGISAGLGKTEKGSLSGTSTKSRGTSGSGREANVGAEPGEPQSTAKKNGDSENTWVIDAKTGTRKKFANKDLRDRLRNELKEIQDEGDSSLASVPLEAGVAKMFAAADKETASAPEAPEEELSLFQVVHRKYEERRPFLRAR